MCRILFFAPFAPFAVKKIPFSAVSISDPAHRAPAHHVTTKGGPEKVPGIYPDLSGGDLGVTYRKPTKKL